jgi:glycosyltransferase involved in cell wall biosynthesis
MKITHVIQSIDPVHGGPPVVATRLAAAQAKSGHDVRLVTYADPGSHAAIEKFLDGLPGREFLKVTMLNPLTGLAESVWGRRARRELKPLISESDFVHAHSVWSTISRKACQVSRELGKPHTLCLHGMLDPWCMSQKRMKKQIAMKLGYYKMLDGCSFIHCLNRDEVGFAEAFGFQAELEIIPNGVFLEEFDPPPEVGHFRADHPELGDRPFILFLSRLHYKKGLDYLALSFSKIAADYPDLMLVVAGPDGGAQHEFESLIRDAGLSDRVILTGPIYGPKKLELLVDSTLFCLPSRQEGFSIAITESLALGVPAVVTDACHYPEVAQAGAGVVTELSVESVVDGLRYVLDMTDEERAQMGENGKGLVREKFTWPIVADRSVEIYKGYMR